MLQEEKHLSGFKKGDELTEQGDNMVDDGNFDLEKFQHGVHFGEPGDYVNHPEDVDQFLFDEKEFFNMNQDGLHNDLNNPANIPSSEFENSDNQLMEIIRNKKKPTPRITVDRTIKPKANGAANDGIAELGNRIPELVPEEIGVKRFKKVGAKERGLPDLSTTGFNVNSKNKGVEGKAGDNSVNDPNIRDIKANGKGGKSEERVGAENDINKKGTAIGELNTTNNNAAKRNIGSLDGLEEVNSMDEVEIGERDNQFKKGVRLSDKDSDIEDSSSNNLQIKNTQFKTKARKAGANREEDASIGGSLDSQENLILGKELPVTNKGNNNSPSDNNDGVSPEGLIKRRERKPRDIQNIKKGLEELEKDDIDGDKGPQ